MPTLDAQTLWLLGAGFAGRLLHVFVTFNRQPWTRQRVVETILGGCGGVVLPSVPGFTELGPWAQILMAATIVYAAADFLINAARQIGARIGGAPPTP